MRKTLLAMLLLLPGWEAAGAESLSSTIPRNDSLKLEIQRAIDKGTEWLVKNQQEGGHWSTEDHPALTALALVALKGNPSEEARTRQAIELGYKFLVSRAKEDGIYGKRQLINYNTSVSLMALAAANNPKYDELIRKTRQDVINGQYDGGENGVADEVFDGGIGYGSSSPLPDMSNTLHALEALYHSRRFAADEGAAGEDLNWAAAIQFIENCQHLPSVNEASWVATNEENKGGFIYAPDQSKAGETQVNGRTALRAYGSISYAGMLSYVYAGLKPQDKRVQAVVDWAKQNYTLQENPGMGMQGYFFYLHTLTKALSAAEIDRLQTVGGKNHAWREEVALKLIDLQNADGSWANTNGRWWEKGPVLSSAYALISLEIIHRGL